MSTEIQVHGVRLVAASPDDVKAGLLGYLAFSVNGLFRFDGVAVRLTAGGRLALAFPKRRDQHGIQHEIVKPLSDSARREIEAQVLAALGQKESIR